MTLDVLSDCAAAAAAAPAAAAAGFDVAIVATDPQEGLGWYLLGRCYMAAHKHELAYAAYEQAV